MELLTPSPPDGSVSALRDALAALAERGQFSARGLRKARADQLTATAPHQVFNLDLGDATRGSVAGYARPTGWRYLLEVDEEIVASAETRSGAADNHTFSQVNDGPFVRGTVRAFEVAEEVAGEQPSEMELRLLHVPAIYLMAVWLQPARTEDAGGSIFIPIAPTPRAMEANRPYGEDEFAGRLREFAAAVPDLASDDLRGGG